MPPSGCNLFRSGTFLKSVARPWASAGPMCVRTGSGKHLRHAEGQNWRQHMKQPKIWALAATFLLAAPAQAGSQPDRTVRMYSFLTDRPSQVELAFPVQDRAMPRTVRFGPQAGTEQREDGYRPVDWLEIAGCGRRDVRVGPDVLARLPAGRLWLARAGTPAGRSEACQLQALRIWFWIASYPEDDGRARHRLWQLSFAASGAPQLTAAGGRDAAWALAARADAAGAAGWRSGRPDRMVVSSSWRPGTFPRETELRFETVAGQRGVPSYRPHSVAVTGCDGPPLRLGREAFVGVSGDFYGFAIRATGGDDGCNTRNMRLLLTQSVRAPGGTRDALWEVRADLTGQAALYGPDPDLLDPDLD